MSNPLGAFMNGGAPQNGRSKDDHYATPAAATIALLQAEQVPHKIWECAAGDGAMSRVLEAAGHEVEATTLYDYGIGGGVDFLQESTARAQAIVTNPPFKLAEAFIRKAQVLGVDYMALVLKATYWHAAERRALWNLWQPARVYALTWRLDFKGLGAPAMEAIWCVWDGQVDRTDYRLLERPRPVL